MLDERDPGSTGSRFELAPLDPDLPAWAPGQLISRRYLLERPLGGGSTGEVWLAEDRLLRKSVALKVLQRELAASRETVHRFLREVALAHSVTHPNVVRIYDTGEATGLPFFTMEYLQGQTLEELLDQHDGQPGESLPFPEIREIAFDVLDGMEAAHRVGVVHRDLKPGNVVLTHRGAIVTDFGVAGIEEVSEAPNAASARSLVRTENGTIFGSPAYMAPELWDGSPATVQSDLYAFGVMIYQMLTGRLPYDASSPAAYLQKLNEGPPSSVRSLRRDTPWSLERLVRRCMASQASERPISAAAAANLIAPLRDKTRRRALLVAGVIGVSAISAYAARQLPTHGTVGLPDAVAEADLSASVRMFDIGDVLAALRSVERLTERFPRSAGAQFWAATMLESVGNHRERLHRCAGIGDLEGSVRWVELARAACEDRFRLVDAAAEPPTSLFPLVVEFDLLPRLEASDETGDAFERTRTQARAALERLEGPPPRDPWALPTRARAARIDLEMALGRFGEARQDLDRALLVDASAPLLQARAAWIALQDGEYGRVDILAAQLQPVDSTLLIHRTLQAGRLRDAWRTIEASPSSPLREQWVDLWCGFAWRFEVSPVPDQCHALSRGLAAALWNESSSTDSVLEDVVAEQERLDPCRRTLRPFPRLTHATPPFELRLGELALETALCRATTEDLDQAQTLAARLSTLAPGNPWLALLFADIQELRGRTAAARSQRLAVSELWQNADNLPRVERLHKRIATDVSASDGPDDGEL